MLSGEGKPEAFLFPLPWDMEKGLAGNLSWTAVLRSGSRPSHSPPACSWNPPRVCREGSRARSAVAEKDARAAGHRVTPGADREHSGDVPWAGAGARGAGTVGAGSTRRPSQGACHLQAPISEHPPCPAGQRVPLPAPVGGAGGWPRLHTQ